MFWPILGLFSKFWGKKNFSQKIRLCHTQLHMSFQHHAKFQKKTNDTIPRKPLDRRMDRRTEGRKYGQILFQRTLRATARGPIKVSLQSVSPSLKCFHLVLQNLFNIFRLQHMRHAIACARLCTRLKHQGCAKKSMPCLIKKTSRCVADRTSKTTFFIFHFL